MVPGDDRFQEERSLGIEVFTVPHQSAIPRKVARERIARRVVGPGPCAPLLYADVHLLRPLCQPALAVIGKGGASAALGDQVVHFDLPQVAELVLDEGLFLIGAATVVEVGLAPGRIV